MHLRNLVKKDRLANPPQTLDPPIFIRSDTSSQEVIHPPSFDQRRRSRSSSTASARTAPLNTAPSPHALRRLSQKLHISRLDSSHNVPSNLPEIVGPAEDAQWERRAALLVGGEERRHGLLATRQTDADIQQAIRLHEAGELQESTRIFERLADPRGANNALSQVLYGLALRHGWGCSPDPNGAVGFLSAAASNAAAIEQLALDAGLHKGGAAKGELVLAIFELANCFRYGWGVAQDAIAAKQYYETAANLGDTDAMNEVAWCYLHGFGCKKDKFSSARYYRLAEQAGNKTLGNSWIWKDKYNPPNSK